MTGLKRGGSVEVDIGSKASHVLLCLSGRQELPPVVIGALSEEAEKKRSICFRNWGADLVCM